MAYELKIHEATGENTAQHTAGFLSRLVPTDASGVLRVTEAAVGRGSFKGRGETSN